MADLLMLGIRDSDSAGTLRNITGWRVRDPANVPRLIQVGKVRDAANVLQAFYNALRMTLDPPDGRAVVYSGGWTFPLLATTLPVTATPTSGTAPYTYVWSQVSGPAGPFAQSPGAATTRFQANFAAAGVLDTIWRCTVSDATGGIATADFRVYFSAS